MQGSYERRRVRQRDGWGWRWSGLSYFSRSATDSPDVLWSHMTLGSIGLGKMYPALAGNSRFLATCQVHEARARWDPCFKRGGNFQRRWVRNIGVRTALCEC